MNTEQSQQIPLNPEEEAVRQSVDRARIAAFLADAGVGTEHAVMNVQPIAVAHESSPTSETEGSGIELTTRRKVITGVTAAAVLLTGAASIQSPPINGELQGGNGIHVIFQGDPHINPQVTRRETTQPGKKIIRTLTVNTPRPNGESVAAQSDAEAAAKQRKALESKGFTVTTKVIAGSGDILPKPSVKETLKTLGVAEKDSGDLSDDRGSTGRAAFAKAAGIPERSIKVEREQDVLTDQEIKELTEVARDAGYDNIVLLYSALSNGQETNKKLVSAIERSFQKKRFQEYVSTGVKKLPDTTTIETFRTPGSPGTPDVTMAHHNALKALGIRTGKPEDFWPSETPLDPEEPTPPIEPPEPPLPPKRTGKHPPHSIGKEDTKGHGRTAGKRRGGHNNFI